MIGGQGSLTPILVAARGSVLQEIAHRTLCGEPNTGFRQDGETMNLDEAVVLRTFANDFEANFAASISALKA